MPKHLAMFAAKQILVTTQDGTQRLFLDLDIECEECGRTQGVIAGHHLRTLHKVIAEVIQTYPELCGTEGTLQETTHFEGVHDPRKATLN